MTLAQHYNYPLQVTATTLQLFQQAAACGYGEEDNAALVALWST